MAESRDDFIIAIRSAFLKKSTKQKFSLLTLVFFSIFIIVLSSLNFKAISLTKSFIKEIVYRSSFIVSIPENLIKSSYYNVNEYTNYYKEYKKTKEELDLLDIALVKKDGPCSNIFSRPQILSDGTVTACACRDVNATLKLGSIYDDPLSYIISSKNPAFSKLVKSMDKGVFPDICRDCTAYRSLYSPGGKGLRHLISAIKKSSSQYKLYKKSIK